MTVPDRNRRTELRAYAARFAAVLTLAVIAAACEMAPTSPVAEDARLAPVEESEWGAGYYSCLYCMDLYDGESLFWDISYVWGAAWRGEGKASGPLYRAMSFELNGAMPSVGGSGWGGYPSPQTAVHQDESGPLGTEYTIRYSRDVRALAIVERRIYVSERNGFVRWLEVITNNSASDDIEVDIRLKSGLGQNGETIEIDGTGSGDLVLGADDSWVSAHAGNRREVAHIYRDDQLTTATAGKTLPSIQLITSPLFDGSAEFFAADYDLTIPVGETRIIMTFVTQAPGTLPPSELSSLATEDALAGISDADKALIVNWNLQTDDTPPTITFSGNAGTYDVSDQVAITCEASDDGSGVATTSCPSVVESPAYELGAGLHEFTATAEDDAGNAASASTSFEVIATADGMATLIDEWVANGGVAGALISKLKGQAGGGGPAALEAVGPGAREMAGKRNERSQAGQLQAFINHVNAIRGRWLTDEQADMLIEFALSL